MDTPKESSGQSRARFWFVFALFILLMGLAYSGAELQARLDAHAAPGLPVHTLLYYRVIFTIWVSIILLTPALCFHVFFLEISVEKGSQAIPCHRNLAVSIDSELARSAQHTTQQMSLQHCSIVAKRKIIRAANPCVQSLIHRCSLVDRLNVGLDLLGLGIGLTALIAAKKHK